jgi:hypothetical protein
VLFDATNGGGCCCGTGRAQAPRTAARPITSPRARHDNLERVIGSLEHAAEREGATCDELLARVLSSKHGQVSCPETAASVHANSVLATVVSNVRAVLTTTGCLTDEEAKVNLGAMSVQRKPLISVLGRNLSLSDAARAFDVSERTVSAARGPATASVEAASVELRRSYPTGTSRTKMSAAETSTTVEFLLFANPTRSGSTTACHKQYDTDFGLHSNYQSVLEMILKDTRAILLEDGVDLSTLTDPWLKENLRRLKINDEELPDVLTFMFGCALEGLRYWQVPTRAAVNAFLGKPPPAASLKALLKKIAGMADLKQSYKPRCWKTLKKLRRLAGIKKVNDAWARFFCLVRVGCAFLFAGRSSPVAPTDLSVAAHSAFQDCRGQGWLR